MKSEKEEFEEDMYIDTHKYIKDFVRVGMPEPQAEVVVRLVHESREYSKSKLATKDQLRLVEQKLSFAIDRLDQKFTGAIDRLDQKFTGAIQSIELKMATKEDLAKMDARQKSWMLAIFLSIIASTAAMFFK